MPHADPERLRGTKTRGEDPVIHFYELFLSEYDPTSTRMARHKEDGEAI